MIENQSPLRFQSESDQRQQLRIPKPIDVVQVQSTATTIYTARDDADFQIENLVASNVTASASTVTIYLVPSGGSPAQANMIVYQLPIAARSGETIFNREHMMMLQPGMTLQALCDTNDDINMFGYGYDYQGEFS